MKNNLKTRRLHMAALTVATLGSGATPDPARTLDSAASSHAPGLEGTLDENGNPVLRMESEGGERTTYLLKAPLSSAWQYLTYEDQQMLHDQGPSAADRHAAMIFDPHSFDVYPQPPRGFGQTQLDAIRALIRNAAPDERAPDPRIINLQPARTPTLYERIVVTRASALGGRFTGFTAEPESSYTVQTSISNPFE